MQQQQENLKKLNTANQPFEIYKRKDIIPHNPFPRIQPPQPVQPLPKDWEGKVAMIDQGFFRLSWNEMYHLARKLGVPDQVITDWRNYRASHDEVSLVSYLETKRKLEIEQAEKAKKVLQQKINSGEFFKDQIIGHLHPSQTKGITILKNQNGVVSVYVPFIGLTYPVSESDMDKKGAFLPTGYVITPHAEYLVNETGKILTKGNGIPSTENAVSIAYLVTGLLQEVLEDTARSSQSIYTKDGFEKRLKEATRLHHNLSGITFPKKPGGMDSETFMTTFLLKLVQNMAFSLGGSSKSLTVTSVPGFFSQGLNANNDLSLFSALTQLHYPVFKEDREKSGIFLPKNYEVTPHADYLVTETAKIVERNHISDTGGVVAFAYVTNNTLREVLEEAARSSTAVYTKDGFNQRLREAFLLHHQYSGNQSLPKVGGVAGMDAQVFMIQELMPRLAGMALGLGGSSKTLLLSNFPGLSQSFNGNGDVSIYSAFTNLHYPVFAEDRGTTGSLLPITYKPTKESDYLIKYTKGYVVDANKIKHQVEELQAIGYLVHEAMEQAVEDCRNGDAWDQQEFYTCLKGMTLHHLQMSGAEWVNTKMGGYFTEQLLPRIIYQAAFHHARIPANKKPFDDQVMQDWLKTDWTGLVKQVGKMQKTDPMSPYDFFDLEGKMGGVGLMAGGAGGGKLGLNRLRGIQNFKNAPPVLQRQPNFQWTVKEANVAPRIGQHPKFGKICKDPTQKVGNKEIWWSKDTAKHGGSNYKLFEEKSDHFSWIGDVDAAGKVVLKHKSEIGKYIFKKEINWIK